MTTAPVPPHSLIASVSAPPYCLGYASSPPRAVSAPPAQVVVTRTIKNENHSVVCQAGVWTNGNNGTTYQVAKLTSELGIPGSVSVTDSRGEFILLVPRTFSLGGQVFVSTQKPHVYKGPGGRKFYVKGAKYMQNQQGRLVRIPVTYREFLNCKAIRPDDEIFYENGTIAMPFMGKDLADLINETHAVDARTQLRPDWRDVVEMVLAWARHLQRLGVIHMDTKPENFTLEGPIDFSSLLNISGLGAFNELVKQAGYNYAKLSEVVKHPTQEAAVLVGSLGSCFGGFEMTLNYNDPWNPFDPQQNSNFAFKTIILLYSLPPEIGGILMEECKHETRSQLLEIANRTNLAFMLRSGKRNCKVTVFNLLLRFEVQTGARSVVDVIIDSLLCPLETPQDLHNRLSVVGVVRPCTRRKLDFPTQRSVQKQ